MLKVETLIELLKSLEVYVAKIEEIRPASIERWKTDTENYWAILHGLQIAVQHVIDLASHIVAGKNLAAPTDYKEVLLELGRNKVTPMEFAEKISGMAGFRNIVIQRYLGVEPQKVFDLAHTDLDDFRVFSEYIYDYLRREGLLPPLQDSN